MNPFLFDSVRLADRFRETGSVCDRKRSRRSTVLTDDVLEDVKTRLVNSPRKSLRKLSSQVGLSYSSVHKAAKKLNMYPYCIRLVQELQPPDLNKRLQYCRCFRSFLNDNGIESLNTVFFSDEAWVHLDGYVNSQNCQIWATENPNAVQVKSLHPAKIGVWCAISRQHIVGPIFFEQTVNGEVYRNIVRQFVALLEPQERYCWFQQDGATCHTSRETMDFLQEFFGDGIISKGLWPPRSPDLTSPDYFLWGYIKSEAFKDNPHNIDELKANITDLITNISNITLKKVSANMVKRVRACIISMGGHFEHMV
ncbi:uncharacterized protein LOC120351176 isoform X3 [Nilaparvata lugens]|uniref:uncharacterized protein LOC120351176 isoform X3 n=1 Tax=Nilaparvata lugens TaxID=108931 RepID=UPI00193D8A8D|nr:uncharacterized protein LOC120351176 isoform X3 [Nilaparvata lugens]